MCMVWYALNKKHICTVRKHIGIYKTYVMHTAAQAACCNVVQQIEFQGAKYFIHGIIIYEWLCYTYSGICVAHILHIYYICNMYVAHQKSVTFSFSSAFSSVFLFSPDCKSLFFHDYFLSDICVFYMQIVTLKTKMHRKTSHILTKKRKEEEEKPYVYGRQTSIYTNLYLFQRKGYVSFHFRI